MHEVTRGRFYLMDHLTFESYSTATVINKQIIERNMSGDSH